MDFFFFISVFWYGRNSICKLHINIKHEKLGLSCFCLWSRNVENKTKRMRAGWSKCHPLASLWTSLWCGEYSSHCVSAVHTCEEALKSSRLRSDNIETNRLFCVLNFVWRYSEMFLTKLSRWRPAGTSAGAFQTFIVSVNCKKRLCFFVCINQENKHLVSKVFVILFVGNTTHNYTLLRISRPFVRNTLLFIYKSLTSLPLYLMLK